MNSAETGTQIHDTKPQISGMGGVGVSYRKKRIEVGVVVGYRRFANHVEGYFYDLDPLTGTVTRAEHYEFIDKSPAVFVTPFVNYHFGTGKALDVYAGVAPSYLRFYNPERPIEGGHGFGAELKAGCARALGEKFSVFGELSGGVAMLPVYFMKDASMYAAALNVGVKMKLKGSPAKSKVEETKPEEANTPE